MKWLLVVLVIVAALGIVPVPRTSLLGRLMFSPTANAQQSAHDSGDITNIQATNISELRTWDAFVTTESRAGSLRLRSVVRDPLLPARVVERFDQFHNGILIWGADIVRDSELGVPVSIFGDLSPALQLSTDPAVSIEDAQTALLGLGGPSVVLLVPQ